MSTNSYVYTLAGVPNSTSVNIYTTGPTQVEWTYYDKDMPNGVTKSRPGSVSVFTNNKEGLPFHIIDNNTNNQTYTYNAKGNLEKMQIVCLSGPRVGELFVSINFLSFDNKPSLFSSVIGYWPDSYPHGDWDYALAFCKNNSKQTPIELYDITKNAFVTQSGRRLFLRLNEKGYPIQIANQYDVLWRCYDHIYL